MHPECCVSEIDWTPVINIKVCLHDDDNDNDIDDDDR